LWGDADEVCENLGVVGARMTVAATMAILRILPSRWRGGAVGLGARVVSVTATPFRIS
jgi:hypothetical protein